MIEKQAPSIFNDVIGPVMRGSSSSHTAASVRLGSLIRQSLNGEPAYCHVEFEPTGSLAATYHEQGADLGLAGGLLGMDLYDPCLSEALNMAKEKGLVLTFTITPFAANHPNTYRIRAAAKGGQELEFTCISTGGGMIEISSINNFELYIEGGYYEALLFYDNVDEFVMKDCEGIVKTSISGYDHVETATLQGKGLINIKRGVNYQEKELSLIRQSTGPALIIVLKPVLPVLSRKDGQAYFSSGSDALALSEKENIEAWQLALRYESNRGKTTEDHVYKMAEEVYDIMEQSVVDGLAGTTFENRILGRQAEKILQHEERLLGGKTVVTLIAKISAAMEAKSAFGLIVAAPTAGSCGVIPGTFTAVKQERQSSKDDMVKALLAAGLIGVIIAKNSTFAAEECGCQAECGSASGMAAAGLVQLAGGTVKQAFDAAAMALQNVFGMVCDPVAERVEVPCLGKNIMAGLNAISCANMAMAGFDKVIPFDETVEAMYQCGKMLPQELRCTGKGGLSVTKTAKMIYGNLNS